MNNLVKINDKIYYIDGLTKVGIIKINDNDVCLIDSGNDKDAGRKIKKILEENNWNLVAIYITHSNADHIGGNKYLQKEYGCKIYAYGIEKTFTSNTILESSFLYGGYPFDDLRHKFLMAKDSECEYLTNDVLPSFMEIIKLPGHFFDMIGFKIDNVYFIADSLSSKSVLDKYQVGFIYDVKEYLNTLEKIKNISDGIFIPSHAEVTSDIKPLVDYNINKVHEIIDKILDICSNPIAFEDILKEIFTYYNLIMNSQQYVLVGSTIKSYLSYLKDIEKIEVIFENNKMLWKKI